MTECGATNVGKSSLWKNEFAGNNVSSNENEAANRLLMLTDEDQFNGP
jgi:hypothetical protein